MSTVKLTTFQRLDIILALFNVGATIIYKCITGPFRGASGASTLDREVSYAATRVLAGHLSIAQLQYVRATSTEVYAKWMRSKGLESVTEELELNTTLYWLGDRRASKVIYYVHGGGYVLPLSEGNLTLIDYLRKSAFETSGVSIAVAILEYTTAPQAAYPTQVHQALLGLQYLFSLGHSPENILLLGDSAGAHIILCLVSHILHKHPALPPLTVPAPFAGLVLISPRVTNSPSAASFAENDAKDILDTNTLRNWISNFMANSVLSTPGGIKADGWYTEPLNAPSEWWGSLSTLIPTVFVSVGEHECFRDDIIAFTEHWQNPSLGIQVDTFVEPRGVHDSPLVDMEAGREPTELTRKVVSWMAAAFARSCA